MDESTVHELKIWKQYFDDVESGRKPFEVRKLDRLFGVGHVLHLREWGPIDGYSGRETKKIITYVMNGGKWGLLEGNCILGIAPITTRLAALDDGQEGKGLRPKVVTLCGSTRFGQAFQDANLHETLKGNIVLSIGCNMKSDHQLFGDLPEQRLMEIKIGLDELHKRKIDLSDEILVLDVDGYIGESTRSEIDYAVKCGLPIRYLSLEGDAQKE